MATYPVRVAYGVDRSASQFANMAAAGFNVFTGLPITLDAGTAASVTLLNTLNAQGLKATVWLGGFVGSPTCDWARTDAQVTAYVSGAMIGHPAIYGYYLADEPPWESACAGSFSKVLARNKLLKSLDATARTLLTIQSFNPLDNALYEYAPVMSAVDEIWVDLYPVLPSANFDQIPDPVAGSQQVDTVGTPTNAGAGYDPTLIPGAWTYLERLGCFMPAGSAAQTGPYPTQPNVATGYPGRGNARAARIGGGVVPAGTIPYVVILQCFRDVPNGYPQFPTVPQLAKQYEQAINSNMKGFGYYSWSQSNPAANLDDYPVLVAELSRQMNL